MRHIVFLLLNVSIFIASTGVSFAALEVFSKEEMSVVKEESLDKWEKGFEKKQESKIETIRTSFFLGRQNNYVERKGNVTINWAERFIRYDGEFSADYTDVYDPAREKNRRTRQVVFKAWTILQKTLGTISLRSGLAFGRTLSEKKREEFYRDVQASQVQEYEVGGKTNIAVYSYFSEAIGNLLYPATAPFLSGISTKLSLNKVIWKEREEIAIPLMGMYTGILIDARHLPVKPAILPVIADKSGAPIYGVFLLSRVAARKNGVVKYFIEDKNNRYKGLGNNIAVIPAAGVSADGINIFLSGKLNENLSFHFAQRAIIDGCRVGILVSP